jgi:hypothetical protein
VLLLVVEWLHDRRELLMGCEVAMARVDPGGTRGGWLACRVGWGSRVASVLLAAVVVLLGACGDADRAEVSAGAPGTAAVTSSVTSSVVAATTVPAVEGTTTAAPDTATAPAPTSSPIADLPGIDGWDLYIATFYLEADSGPEPAGYVPQDARDALGVFAARHGLAAARVPEAPPAEIGAITSTADGPDPAGNASVVWLDDSVGAVIVSFSSTQTFAGDEPLPTYGFDYMAAPAGAPFVAGSCEWDWVARGWGRVEPVEVAPGVAGCLVTSETSHHSLQRLVWARDGIAYAIEQDSISVPAERLIELANAPSIAISEL